MQTTRQCPTPQSNATIVWGVITGQLYHATRVDALLATVALHMEAMYLFSDTTDRRYCTTKLDISLNTLSQILAIPTCNISNHHKNQKLTNCDWLIAQTRWRYGLRYMGRKHNKANWFSLIDDDSFVVVPTVLRALRTARTQHDNNTAIYAMGRKGWGGGGHYFNREWVGHFENNFRRCESYKIHSSDGWLQTCHDAVISRHNNTAFVDFSTMGYMSYSSSGQVGGYHFLCTLNNALLRSSPRAFRDKYLHNIVVMTVKQFGESARVPYQILYLGRYDLLNIVGLGMPNQKEYQWEGW